MTFSRSRKCYCTMSFFFINRKWKTIHPMFGRQRFLFWGGLLFLRNEMALKPLSMKICLGMMKEPCLPHLTPPPTHTHQKITIRNKHWTWTLVTSAFTCWTWKETKKAEKQILYRTMGHAASYRVPLSINDGNINRTKPKQQQKCNDAWDS